MKEVRCEQCGQLMAMVLDNGLIECKNGRRVILTERALLSCLKCGHEVLCEGEEKSGVDNGGRNG